MSGIKVSETKRVEEPAGDGKVVQTRRVEHFRDAQGNLLYSEISDITTYRVTAGKEHFSFIYERGISREALVANIKEILELVSHPTFTLY